MVFHDLSSSSIKEKSTLKRASVGDRTLAFFIDILLLTPLIQIIIAPFVKRIELLTISAPDSLELSAFIFVAAIIIVALIIFYQTLCWSRWGATPGKYFLKLRVVDDHHPEMKGIPWGHALLRSILWCFQFILLGVPFLEVLSHRHRRPLHDRASETSVVTLKELGDGGPHPIETHFVRQAILVVALVVSSWIFFGVGKVYRLAMEGSFKKDDLMEDNGLCSRVSEESNNRIDEALALFLVGEVSDECVEKEADFVLWTPGSPKKSWAFLARGISSQDKSNVATDYLKKVCEIDQGEACRIAEKILDNGKQIPTNISEWTSLTAKILQLESLERQGQTEELIKAVAKFPSDNFKEPLVGYLMRGFWSNHDLEKARGIFEAENLTTDLDSKRSLAAWMCLQELELNCEKSSGGPACSVISQTLTSAQVEVAWAQVKLRECRRSSDPPLQYFQEIIAKRPDFKTLLEASVRETSWPAAQRAAHLEQIARKSRGLMQSLATREWLNYIANEKQLQSVFDVLEAQKNHDWKWQSNVLKAFQRAYAMKEFELGFEISQLVNSGVFVRWELDHQLVVTAFKADQKKWAYDFWKNQTADGASRAPASSADSTSGTNSQEWKEVENSLKKMREAK